MSNSVPYQILQIVNTGEEIQVVSDFLKHFSYKKLMFLGVRWNCGEFTCSI